MMVGSRFSPLVIGAFRDRSPVSFSLLCSLFWVAAPRSRTTDVTRAEEPRLR
jgi:hypothetical protein